MILLLWNCNHGLKNEATSIINKIENPMKMKFFSDLENCYQIEILRL